MFYLKLLVQSLVWSIAVLAMNAASADESSMVEFFNEKNIPNLESKDQTTKPEVNHNLVKKASDINETKLNLNDSLHNRDENDKNESDKAKQRKTHYGIGYEYRKSKQEQVQRARLVARPEKTQRPERIERIEKIERPERPERINRPERIDRPDRPGRR